MSANDTLSTFHFQLSTEWIGAITNADSHLPTGKRNMHGPSFKNPDYKAIYDSIHPLALQSINLRTEFAVGPHIEEATVYISGLGHYTLYINGARISGDLFTPAWSDYDKTVYFNSYQADSLIRQGGNAIGVTLGNGFYNTVSNRYRKMWLSFGPPTLYFELHIRYSDGQTQVIRSDASWKYAPSPITFNDIYGGEDYDARLEQPGWNNPGFDDSLWKEVVIQEAPSGRLRPQLMPPVRSMKQYEPQDGRQIDSVLVFDMGQNLSGFPSIKVEGERGQKIKLTVGERLDETTGRVTQRQTGSPHTYTYILKGEGVEEWQPQFSYYGFRYIEVEGATAELIIPEEKPELIDIRSHFIYSSVGEDGSFECSNPLFNEIHELIKNAMRSNMQAVFTDCPHREKLGWLEQTHLCGPGLLYNWDLRNVYPKVMQDIADVQQPDGMIPATAPEYLQFEPPYEVFRNSPEWGIAGVLIPWLYYRFYGDDSLITGYYYVAKRYVDYLSSQATDYILNIGLGDWYDYRPGEKGGFSANSPIEVSATAHYYYAAHHLSLSAQLTNNNADMRRYALLSDSIKEAFNRRFFNVDTKQYANGSQFCNAVAIYMDLVEPQYKQAVLENLKADIAKHNTRLTTGDVGNRYLFMALALNGENELMYRMHNHYDVPGYGYQLLQGATTLTEQWDPRMGSSWNHFMMGQIDEWFYRSLAGIEPAEPGFGKFTVRPQLVGDLTWVKAAYHSPYGKIEVEWTRNASVFGLTVNVPDNTTAIIVMPGGEEHIAGTGVSHFSEPLAEGSYETE